MKSFILILSVYGVVRCAPLDKSVVRSVVENFVNCQDGDLNFCLKERALQVVERLNSARELHIFGGVNFVNNNPRNGKSIEALPNDIEKKKSQINKRLWDSASYLLENSDLEYTYAPENDSNAVAEGRAKIKKKLKMLAPLILVGNAIATIKTVIAETVSAISLATIALAAIFAVVSKIIEVIKEKSKCGDHCNDWHIDDHHLHHYPSPPSATWDGGSSVSSAAWNSNGPYGRSLVVGNDLAYSGQIESQTEINHESR